MSVWSSSKNYVLRVLRYFTVFASAIPPTTLRGQPPLPAVLLTCMVRAIIVVINGQRLAEQLAVGAA